LNRFTSLSLFVASTTLLAAGCSAGAVRSDAESLGEASEALGFCGGPFVQQIEVDDPDFPRIHSYCEWGTTAPPQGTLPKRVISSCDHAGPIPPPPFGDCSSGLATGGIGIHQEAWVCRRSSVTPFPPTDATIADPLMPDPDIILPGSTTYAWLDTASNGCFGAAASPGIYGVLVRTVLMSPSGTPVACGAECTFN
jgi:hypothetical protein